MSVDIHVYPVGDIFEHNTEALNCNCNPKLQFQRETNSWLVIHRSYDRRENDEENAITKDTIN